MTRAQVLKHALSFALGKLRFKHAPLGLPEHERIRLADDAVNELRRFGHWKELDEEAGGSLDVRFVPIADIAPTTTSSSEVRNFVERVR